MSVKWMSYIWDKTDYKEGELLTALALADFANDEGECFPFIETIAKKARLSVRQIQRIMHNFEADGFLQIERFQGRGKKPKIKLKKVTSTTPFKDRKKVTLATLKGDIGDIKKVTLATPPSYKEEPLIEPIINQSQNDAVASDGFVSENLNSFVPETVSEAWCGIQSRKGILPTAAIRQLGKLIKDFGASEVNTAFVETAEKLKTATDAVAYFTATLNNRKNNPASAAVTAPRRRVWTKEDYEEYYDKTFATV